MYPISNYLEPRNLPRNCLEKSEDQRHTNCVSGETKLWNINAKTCISVYIYIYVCVCVFFKSKQYQQYQATAQLYLELTHRCAEGQVAISEQVPQRAQKALKPLWLFSCSIRLVAPFNRNEQARPHELVKGKQSVRQVETAWNLPHRRNPCVKPIYVFKTVFKNKSDSFFHTSLRWVLFANGQQPVVVHRNLLRWNSWVGKHSDRFAHLLMLWNSQGFVIRNGSHVHRAKNLRFVHP